MKNDKFKTEMFRFVDVLPYLSTSSAVARHLQEYFCREDLEFPSALQWGLGCLSPDSMAAKVVAKGVKANITKMAKQFITGATPEDALPNIVRIRKSGLAFTLDLLGETTLSWSEAKDYQKRYLDLLETLLKKQHSWPSIGGNASELDWDLNPKVNISIKPSSFNPRLHPAKFETSLKETIDMIRPIFGVAQASGAFINIDVEHYFLKDLALALFQGILNDDEFRGFPHAGVVIQSYLRDSEKDLRELIKCAKDRETRVTVRLVKGAYWDYEIVAAKQEGWPIPVFEEKAETDANFERLAALILDNNDAVRLACASHNLRSIAFVLEYSNRLRIPENDVEFQVLFGMAEPVRIALEEEQVPLRVYATVGELIPGMAYLVRRLLENTSNESFLRKVYADQIPFEPLIEDPRQQIPIPKAEPPQEFDQVPFINEPRVNWANPEERASFKSILESVRKSLGRLYPIYINGKWIKTRKRTKSFNPAKVDEVIGTVCPAGKKNLEQALKAAEDAFPSWRAKAPEERAEYLFRAADQARSRKNELAALQVFEVGKTWTEADADVAEAIDFLNFYAQEMIRLSKSRNLPSPPGEDNRYIHQPRGLAAVIAPWNFPLAISMGMVSAALVTGNCVLYKPAGLSPIMGAAMVGLFHDAGLPHGALAYLPGAGETVGRILVTSPKISIIAFTGSRDVGLEIIRRASSISKRQNKIKKVVAELGGKNAIIVDSNADLDEAVAGILKSAFGFQGQKCSACSRAIVVEDIYDRFVERLVPAAEALVIGDPADPETDIGPLISNEAKEKVLGYCELGKKEGRLLLFRKGPDKGSFGPLAIFDRIDPQSPLAQDEIFGPVLCIMKVKDIHSAIKVANDVAYALTGGLYSRSPKNIELAMKEFRVGNLYINRGITGAMVARQPFGGFKMSGTGSKAGGPDYLTQFMETRCITENTLRRGFAPEQTN